MTGLLAKLPTRSFGPCRSTRIPIGRPCSASTARIDATSSRMRSCVVWLMLMRKTSAPAWNRLAIMLRSEDAGPRVATILVRRRRRISFGFAAAGAGGAGRPRGRRRLQHRHARLQRLHRHLIGRFGELDRPRRLVAGVDLEEAGAVVAARQTIVGAADGELLVARAHEGLARPFAAAIVVERVDVIEAGDQRAAQHGFAAAGGQVPPALGGPAFVLLVADRDPDPAAGVVAEAEIGLGRLARSA